MGKADQGLLVKAQSEGWKTPENEEKARDFLYDIVSIKQGEGAASALEDDFDEYSREKQIETLMWGITMHAQHYLEEEIGRKRTRKETLQEVIGVFDVNLILNALKKLEQLGELSPKEKKLYEKLQRLTE